jgi:hypothetical protein
MAFSYEILVREIVATARCDRCGPPIGLRLRYPRRHMVKQERPFRCGAAKCLQKTRNVWLSEAQEAEYVRGERLFALGSRDGKIEVK